MWLQRYHRSWTKWVLCPPKPRVSQLPLQVQLNWKTLTMSYIFWQTRRVTSMFSSLHVWLLLCFCMSYMKLVLFRGHGTVVGILKVGRKKLFVYDLSGSQWEMEPLCVLDFYVYESKQRSGCGRALFEYMLKVTILTSISTESEILCYLLWLDLTLTLLLS